VLVLGIGERTGILGTPWLLCPAPHRLRLGHHNNSNERPTTRLPHQEVAAQVVSGLPTVLNLQVVQGSPEG
jgi:hypothetical protein